MVLSTVFWRQTRTPCSHTQVGCSTDSSTATTFTRYIAQACWVFSLRSPWCQDSLGAFGPVLPYIPPTCTPSRAHLQLQYRTGSQRYYIIFCDCDLQLFICQNTFPKWLKKKNPDQRNHYILSWLPSLDALNRPFLPLANFYLNCALVCQHYLSVDLVQILQKNTGYHTRALDQAPWQ